jgi:protein SCO1/2
MPRRRFLVLSLGLFISTAAPRAAFAATQTYRTRGTIRHIAKDRRRVRIRHDDIPGFMKAMTMPFDADPKLLAGVAEGDHVTFTFEAREDGSCVIVALAASGGDSRT